MHVLVEATEDQLEQIIQITGTEPIPAALAESGAIANLNFGPAILEQLAPHLGVHWSKMPSWEKLDRQTQQELAILTVDSAPWAMDQALHDTAAEDLSDRTVAILLGSEHPA